MNIAIDHLKREACRPIYNRVALDYLMRGGPVPAPEELERELDTLSDKLPFEQAARRESAEQRLSELTWEELEGIHSFWEEPYFMYADADDYEADDRADATVAALDRVEELIAEAVGAAARDAQRWARETHDESSRFEAADEAIVHLASLLGVVVEPDSVFSLYLDPDDVGDEDGEWVDRAILMVLNHVDGGADVEVARIDPADIENREYVEVTLTNGRTVAVRGTREV